MDGIETFFTAHQHTIAALAAISTFAAVVASLVVTYISQKASRTRVTATVAIHIIVDSTIQREQYPEYVMVSVTNIGIMSAALPFAFFCWKVPFARDWMLIYPLDFDGDKWIQKRRYPIEISPRRSTSICLSEIKMFRENLDKIINTHYFGWLRMRWLRAYVFTEDGHKFRVKLDRSIRKEQLLSISRGGEEKHAA
jgi:hypothetical protein